MRAGAGAEKVPGRRSPPAGRGERKTSSPPLDLGHGGFFPSQKLPTLLENMVVWWLFPADDILVFTLASFGVIRAQGVDVESTVLTWRTVMVLISPGIYWHLLFL